MNPGKLISLFGLLLMFLAAGPAPAQLQPPGMPSSGETQIPQNPFTSPDQPGTIPQNPFETPGQPVTPPAQPAPSAAGGPGFNDPFGLYRLTLPQGVVPVSSTYNFGMPQEGIQVNFSAAQQEEVFQTALKNYPATVQSMGGVVQSHQEIKLYGHQCVLIAATLLNVAGATQMASFNVFIPAAGIWIQVNSPLDRISRAEQLLEGMLQSLKY